MCRHAKAIWTLIAVATIFPELVTGSTPLFRFFHPNILLILFVAYGLSVLAVREIAVRLRLTYWGIYLLGFAYAVVNEGFLAKTMLMHQGLPIPQFDRYGYFAGVSFPWTFTISAWHALASVLLPIVFTYWLWPGEKAERWLRNRTLGLLGAFLALFTGVFFFSRFRFHGTVPHYLFLMFMMLFWFLAAFWFGREKAGRAEPNPGAAAQPSRRPVWKIFLLGASTLVPTFLVLPQLAARKIPVPIFMVFLAIEIGLYAWVLKKMGWADERGILLFGAGFYAQQAVLGIAAGFLKGSVVLIITDVVMIGVFVVLGRRIGVGGWRKPVSLDWSHGQ